MIIRPKMVPRSALGAAAVMVMIMCALLLLGPGESPAGPAEGVALPQPVRQGSVSVEQALATRRTHRTFAEQGLDLAQVGQVLWAADGLSGRSWGRWLRTAPSAGALYPLIIYLVAGDDSVRDLPAGVYTYLPDGHRLMPLKQGDLRQALAGACLEQMWLITAPVSLVVTGQYSRATAKYGRRGVIYTHIEAGHVGQNIFLQAEAAGLKAGIIGAFDNKAVIATLGLPQDHDPILVMPLGLAP